MIRFFKRLLFVILLGLVGAVVFLGYVRLEDSEIGLILEKDTGRCVGVIREEHNPVWQGIDLVRYEIKKMPLAHEFSGVFALEIPGLEDLDRERYTLSVPLRLSYTINRQSFNRYDLLSADKKGIHELITSFVKGELERKTSAFLSPAYKRDELVESLPVIIDSIQKDLQARLAPYGIGTGKLVMAGSFRIPLVQVYQEGIRQAARIVSQAQVNDLEMQKYLAQLKRQDESHRQYVKQLEDISKLISQNPDIIKYIYIDKFSADKKSNIPANGIPPFFLKKPGVTAVKKVTKPKGSIDNFKYD